MLENDYPSIDHKTEVIIAARLLLATEGKTYWDQEKNSPGKGLRSTLSVHFTKENDSFRGKYRSLLGYYFLTEGDNPELTKRTVYLGRYEDGKASEVVVGFRYDGKIEDKNGEICDPTADELSRLSYVLKAMKEKYIIDSSKSS